MKKTLVCNGPIVYYVPGGGGERSFWWGVQFLKKVNLVGVSSFENVQSVSGVEILRQRINIICCSC